MNKIIVMISHEKKFIFIHNPKCGGNSITKMLESYISNKILESFHGNSDSLEVLDEKYPIDVKHKGIVFYEFRYPDKWENYFKFTVVRNPYDRIMSFYLWNRRLVNKEFDLVDFELFLDLALKSKFKEGGAPPPLSFLLRNSEGLMKMDLVMKLEDLESELVKLEKRLNITIDKSIHVNKTEIEHSYMKMYSKKAIKYVNELYKEDFELFSYPMIS